MSNREQAELALTYVRSLRICSSIPRLSGPWSLFERRHILSNREQARHHAIQSDPSRSRLSDAVRAARQTPTVVPNEDVRLARLELQRLQRREQMIFTCNYFSHLARLARRDRVGNCAEQAAIAYFHLSARGTLQVALIGFVSGLDDHAVAVVGLEPNVEISNGIIVTDRSEWGSDPWICDPTEHAVYRPIDLDEGHPPRLICYSPGPQ